MVNILFGILKAIGVLLLVVLCLLLFLILIVMLGPICYRADGRYKEDKACSASVSWLGIVLRCRADYNDEQGFLWGIRLFGILIASNNEEFIQKKEEKRKKKAEIEKAKTKEPAEESVTEEWLPEEEILSETEHALVEMVEKPAVLENKQQENNLEQTHTESEEGQAGLEQSQSGPERMESAAKVTKPKKKITVIIKEKYNLVKNAVRNLIEKIKAIPVKMKNTITSFKAKVARILEWKEFFLGEKNREGFLHILKNLKKMAIHILPRKLEGKVEFGVEDPYVMGQILTVLGVFYPIYQDKFTVLPDFENPGFAGEASLRGRIIPGYLFLRLLILICNREVIRIIKEGRQLIGGKEV